MGTGTFTLTAPYAGNTAAGTLTLGGGALTLAGATGGVQFGTVYLNPAGTLSLDNSSTLSVNRIVDSATVNLQGGMLQYIANAAGSSTETIGTLNPLTGGGSTITLNANGTGAITLTATLGAAANGTTLLLQGPKLGTATGTGRANLVAAAWNATVGQGAANGANGSQTMAVRADAIGLDNSTTNQPTFLTHDTSGNNFLRPLASAEMTTFVSGGGSSLSGASNNNVLVSGTVTINASTTLNTVTFSGSSGLTGPAFWLSNGAPANNTLTINSGGMLIQATPGSPVSINLGNGGIIDSWYNSGRNPLIVHGFGNAVLTGYIQGQVPYFTKSGSGGLTLNSQQFYAATTAVDGGILTLATSLTTALPIASPLPIQPSAGVFSYYDLWVNSGTVDLLGKNQIVQMLRSVNSLPGIGGTITSSGGAAILVAAPNSTGTFAGTLTGGGLSFVKAGSGTLSLTGNSTYGGTTTVAGSTLELKDGGMLSGTSAIDVDYATLQLNNQGLTNVSNRVPATAGVNLRGGTINYLGALGAASSQTMGTTTLVDGANTITASAGALGTADLTIARLQRNAGSTVNFTGTGLGGLVSDANGYGLNAAVSHVYLTLVDGADPATTVNANNGILGGWAIVNDRFATYNATLGVGPLAATGFSNQSSANLLSAGPTDNIDLGIVMAGVNSRTINSLRVYNNNLTITMATATDRLTIGSGGMIVSGTGTNSMVGGQLSAGQTPGSPAELFLHVYENLIISSQIVDNGSGGRVTLVKDLADASHAGIVTLRSANAYTGGTVVNAGTLFLSAFTSGVVTLPAGGLTINNATVTMNNFAGQIDPSNSVTLHGGGVLNLLGTNTLAGLTLGDDGATGNPTVNVGTTLTLNGDIAATNNNPATFALINQGQLDLAGRNATISVGGIAPNGLRIDSIIRNGGIVKTGTGTLTINAIGNVFAGGVDMQGGTLIVGQDNVLGGGTLTLRDGTAIMAGQANVNLSNSVVVNGSFTFGGASDNRVDLNLNGPMTLNAIATMTVASPWTTDTLGGAITGSGGITKAGPGLLELNSGGSTTYSGATRISGGSIVLGAVNATSPNSDMKIDAGSLLNLNGKNTMLGALSGGGTVTNPVVNTVTLTLGANNGSGTFSGTFATASGGQLIVTKTGTGNQVLSSQTYDGVATINNGTLTATTLANGGSPSSVGQSSSAPANLVLNGGTLKYIGSTTTTNRQFTLGPYGGTLDASGIGTVNFASTTTVTLSGNSPRTLTLSGSNTGDNTLAAPLGNDAGGHPTSLLKKGSGTWVLTSANSYTGGTTVTDGILKVANVDALPPGQSLTIGQSGTVVLQSDLLAAIELSGLWFTGGSGATAPAAASIYDGPAGGRFTPVSAPMAALLPAPMDEPVSVVLVTPVSAPVAAPSPGMNANARTAPVPEPGTLVLLAAGGLSLLAFSWQRRKRRSGLPGREG